MGKATAFPEIKEWTKKKNVTRRPLKVLGIKNCKGRFGDFIEVACLDYMTQKKIKMILAHMLGLEKVVKDANIKVTLGLGDTGRPQFIIENIRSKDGGKTWVVE